MSYTRKGHHNSRPPCIFHLRGACNKGASCQFSHSNSESLEELVLCRYHISGACRYGQYCQLAHGLPCPHCNSNILHPHNKRLANQHLKMCEQKTKLMKSLPQELLDASSSVECGICLETIANKGNRFGLMTGCDHAFCIGCIRLWRNKSHDVSNPSAMVKACPTCRKDSLFIIPSLIYCTGEMKQHIVEQYKNNMKYKACKYFAKAGNCPFGSDCFYAHYNQDGSLADTSNMKNIVKNRHNRYNNNSRLEFHSYEMDVVNLLSQLSHMSPTYVMELLMDMLADEDEDWVDY
eukprot:Phypoly_transcript_12646.p1 GENE.Phypoly_transcript_12646~~Phypoly_transcript_12646.p1  ORF type:complete len:292 (+),score=14.95 Phypoly_transcript_12646:137-1012(+)